jgi:hypothetical protein
MLKSDTRQVTWRCANLANTKHFWPTGSSQSNANTPDVLSDQARFGRAWSGMVSPGRESRSSRIFPGPDLWPPPSLKAETPARPPKKPII